MRSCRKDCIEDEREHTARAANGWVDEVDAIVPAGLGTTARAYILAGGRSSRMGRDKAMMPLAGRTLLGRAVDTLRAVPGLRNSNGKVVVTIVGERAGLEGADRAIVDRYPGCGPLGGMEAALRDLEESGGAEWALFVPVDMPFLPSGLIDALLREWSEAGRRGAKACYVVVDGRAQPLVSMLHKTLHPFLYRSLTDGQFKVTPVLQSAADVLASFDVEGIVFNQSALHTTYLDFKGCGSQLSAWAGHKEHEQLKHLWFLNLNSEEDFLKAETYTTVRGSN